MILLKKLQNSHRALSSDGALEPQGVEQLYFKVDGIYLLFLGSGESGAGKTESTKLLLQHIMNLCKGNLQLEQQILQVGHCRMLLEGAEATLLQDHLH